MARARIYGFSRSTWTQTAQMVCIEKSIDHELLPLAYGSDEHGRMHPYRRIPVVEVDGLVLFETLAIACYLDEAVAEPPLQPGSLQDRALMRTWMGVCSDYLFREVVRAIPRDREPNDEELSAARLALERAEGLMVGGTFLVGLPRLAAWSETTSERESFRLTR